MCHALSDCGDFLERRRLYSQACQVQELVLAHSRDASQRARTWERLTIDYEHAGGREQSTLACRRALADPELDGWELPAIQRRLQKQVDKRVRLDDGLQCEPAGLLGLRVVTARHPAGTKPGAKAVFISPDDLQGTCGVEALALHAYAEEGWVGVHNEGRSMRLLFRTLCWDVLFASVVDAFVSPFQTRPSDLADEAFFARRGALCEAKLAEIAELDASPRALMDRVDESWRALSIYVGFPFNSAPPSSAMAAAAAQLDLERDFKLVKLLAFALRGPRAARLCALFLKSYRRFRSGAPDLMLFRRRPGGGGAELEVASALELFDSLRTGDEVEVMFAEVKSANDRLRDHQASWLKALSEDCGVPVEMFKVTDQLPR
jgi:hypothetical protein